MRDIEFRGKDANGSWVYGDVHFGKDNLRAHIHPTKGSNMSIEVDPETVGQYTGLKDKNGVKIYEGDQTTSLDRDGHVVTSTVEWDDVWLGWYPFCVPINYEEVLLDLNFVEVIGNIHGGLI